MSCLGQPLLLRWCLTLTLSLTLTLALDRRAAKYVSQPEALNPVMESPEEVAYRADKENVRRPTLTP